VKRDTRYDVAYLDPPYNQHSYLGNYHVWESLVRWDKPEVYGVACKRVDVKARRSVFNSRPRCAAALRELLGSIRARTIVLSFNDEGYLDRADIETMLGELWNQTAHVATIPNDFRRYVGARIGIYSPRGEKVGSVGRLTNTEFIYIAARSPIDLAQSPAFIRARSA